MGVTPTPLPIVELKDIKGEDVEGSFRAIKASLENILVFLERIREVVFDSSTTDSLGAQISNLASRPKDTYTFPIGTPAVTPTGPDDPGYAVVPLDAVFDGTVVEVYARGQKAAKGPITIQVLLAGTVLATLAVTAGQSSVAVTENFPNKGEVKKRQSIKVKVTAAPEDPGFDDAVVMVMVR